MRKALWLLLFMPCLCFGADLDVRHFYVTNDVSQARQSVAPLKWYEGESVKLDLYVKRGSAAVTMTNAGTFARWEAFLSTNNTTAYLMSTGTIQGGGTNGYITFDLRPEDANLPTNVYKSFVKIYEPVGGTNRYVGQVYATDLQILWGPNSSNIVYRGPYTNSTETDPVWLAAKTQVDAGIAQASNTAVAASNGLSGKVATSTTLAINGESGTLATNNSFTIAGSGDNNMATKTNFAGLSVDGTFSMAGNNINGIGALRAGTDGSQPQIDMGAGTLYPSAGFGPWTVLGTATSGNEIVNFDTLSAYAVNLGTGTNQPKWSASTNADLATVAVTASNLVIGSDLNGAGYSATNFSTMKSGTNILDIVRASASGGWQAQSMSGATCAIFGAGSGCNVTFGDGATFAGTVSASSMAVTNGNLNLGGNTASNGSFVGNGSGLTNLTGANVSGAVPNASYASYANVASNLTADVTNYFRNAANQTNNTASFTFAITTNAAPYNTVDSPKLRKAITITNFTLYGGSAAVVDFAKAPISNLTNANSILVYTGLTCTADSIMTNSGAVSVTIEADYILRAICTNGAITNVVQAGGDYTW